MPDEGIGWGEVTTSETRYPHEVINIFPNASSRITQKCIPLYKKGYSLSEVSQMTGVPTTSIYDKLKKLKLQCRQRSKSIKTNPPFGYAWLSGKLVINPVEFKTVQLIQNLHSTGMRPYHIEKHLNNHNIPTRKGGKWLARIISNVLKSAREQTSTG